ncbi:MAG: hypothetical protein A2Y62_05405 [Candidatus Fischerbacteria bacterium RBG_13_37_8]|uniref:5'-Nucleotidase C-terminal domain-containing protein n=1 Tax=Candidatus Fischerbacteria bacterium RBG_13_37_8 TaxID=1817863 RepID=A0A1F5VXR3_9BACT|nr:MAG: hypothetical protein A2Y62_05405 [Candidatus Fischerbacteria bacterium RBG_13_37_8]
MFTGIDKVKSYMKNAKYEFLSSNLVNEKSGKPIFKDHVIITEKVDKVGKMKIGVIGFTRYVASMWDVDDGTRIKVADYYIKIAKDLVPTLQKKTDMIIALVHMTQADAQQLAKEVPGIDVILGSYGSERTQTPLKVNNTFIAYSGYQGKGLGEARIFIDKKKKITDFKDDYIILTKDYPDDTEMLAFVNDVQQKAAEYQKQKQEEQRKATQPPPPAQPPDQPSTTQAAPEETNPPH